MTIPRVERFAASRYGCGPMKRTLALLLCLVASAASAQTVTLSTGETLTGPITAQTDATITMQHPVLGPLTIPRENITAIVADESPADDAPEAVQPAPVNAPVAEPEPTPQVEQPTGFFAGWSNKLEIGFNVSSGNSDSSDGRIRFTSAKENDYHRWAADAAYYVAYDDGDKTDSDFTVGLLKDWLDPDSKWFWWAKGRYDYDEFESWDHRVTAGGGPGYHLIQEDNFTLDLRAGMGLAREWGSDEDDIKPEAQLGAEAAWTIDDRQSIVADTWLYPDLGDLGEYRWTASAAWQMKLDMKRGLALKFGVENEYESEVDPGSENNDLKLFGALVFDF